MNIQLADFLEQRKDMPFEWGKHDCCLFVCDWVERVIGIDIAVDFRGQYKTEKGAFKLLFKRGLNDVESIFNARLNPEIPRYYARRGDLALVKHNGELVGGIIQINTVVCVGEDALIYLPIEDVVSVFPLFPRETSQ